GGLCYFLWDSNYDNDVSLTKVFTHRESEDSVSVLRSLKTDKTSTFVRHNEAVEIIDKINSEGNFKSFAEFVSPLRPFGFRGYFTNDEKFRSKPDGLNSPVICYGKGKSIGY